MRTLIVDDEVWARRRVARLLEAESDVELAGECDTGTAAVEHILTERPDLVILDIQMPDMTGFEVLEAVCPEYMPRVIFATAYDSYAIRAFDANAVDYLLKPFDPERFHTALSRARREIGSDSLDGRLKALLQSVTTSTAKQYLERIVVRSGGRVLFLRVDEIARLEASGNYITVHARGETHLLRDTMSRLESQLDPNVFLRIHRSSLVNLDYVSHVEPWFGGELAVSLKDGARVTVGRSYCDRIRRLFGNSAK